jgi:drug/metabolite transporter (DMT)-like permease
VSRRAWALFAAVSLLWGVPYLFIKVAVEDLSPASVVFWRTAVAALVLLPLALRRGAFRGLRPRYRALIVLALVQVVVPFTLISVGEQYIASSLTGLLIALEPAWVALIAAAFVGAERVRGRRVVGLAVGLVGVALLLGVDVGLEWAQLVGAALIIGATISYAAGALLIKQRFSDRPPLGFVTVTLAISAVVMAPAAAFSMPTAVPDMRVIGALLALAIPCTAVGFIVFFDLIAVAGASRAAVITYVTPVVAVAAGVAVLDERITLATLAGLLLILAGSWLATVDRRRRNGGAQTRSGPLESAAGSERSAIGAASDVSAGVRR